MKRTFFALTFVLTGCVGIDVEEGQNGMPMHATYLEEFNDWKWDQPSGDINNIDHLLFKAQHLTSQLDILKLKGGLNCIPAQIKISERYIKRFYAEYYNKLMLDSQSTLVKLEQQNKKIELLLKEIKFETACLPDEKYYLTELNKKIRKIEAGGIYFEMDSDKLSKDSLRKTRQIIYLLKDVDITGAIVYGHTSEENNLDYNYKLGKRRANRVKQVFIDEGFDENKVIWRSYSKLHRNSESPEKNRRVTIKVEEENIEAMESIHKIKVDYRMKDWNIEQY